MQSIIVDFDLTKPVSIRDSPKLWSEHGKQLNSRKTLRLKI